jgi:MtaA/CmuA family methyltransferase
MKHNMQHMVFPINALPAAQMVKAGIDQISWDADLKFEAVRRYYEKVDADVLFYFSDIAIQAEAMGARVKYSAERMPVIEAPAQTVLPSNPATSARMNVNAQVLKRMEKEYPDKLRAALVYGPFTVAGQILGEERLLRRISNDEDEAIAYVEKAYNCARSYAVHLADAGANLLWVSDPLAALIPPTQFWKFAGIYLKSLFDTCNSIPTILHICGDTYNIVSEMVRTGVEGISFDNCMDLFVVEDLVPKHVNIIGNIDPVAVIELGSESEINHETSDVASSMGIYPNFVLSTGCAVPPQAPVGNVKVFIESGKRALESIAPHASIFAEMARNVSNGNSEGIVQGVETALQAGIDPENIISIGLMRSIRKGSSLYEIGECFLPEILCMVDTFNAGFRLLENKIKRNKDENPAVVLGTVKGDIHEIGKSLVKVFLETRGHKVVDLGVDVDAARFAEACHQYHPSIVGLSIFNSGSRKEAVKVLECLRAEDIENVSVIIGGVAVNNEYCHSIGAQGYASDAVKAVRLVEKLLHLAGQS